MTVNAPYAEPGPRDAGERVPSELKSRRWEVKLHILGYSIWAPEVKVIHGDYQEKTREMSSGWAGEAHQSPGRTGPLRGLGENFQMLQR